VSETVEGTGIGLYLTRKIASASGGKIELESEAGKVCNLKYILKYNESAYKYTAGKF
jgi:light-regulated signal transduction histidine kinase (bacteriophytochrome)